MKIEITQKVPFECAYIDFSDFEHPELNAHKYVLEATCLVDSDVDVGKMLSFEDFRKVMKSIVPDKCFLKTSIDACPSRVSLYSEYLLKANNVFCALSEINIPIEEYHFIITTETLVNHFANKIQFALFDYQTYNSSLLLVEAKLKENNNSYATWRYR